MASSALIEIRRPPNNFFDIALIREIADALEALDADAGCRAVVLASQGKSFCAGANFGDGSRQTRRRRARRRIGPVDGAGHLYIEAVRLFRTKKPIVGAIQGAAVGGGLGLAMVADFRVTCPEARFAANFTRLGFHPGFGLTTTLPEAIGKHQRRADVLHRAAASPAKKPIGWGSPSVLVPQDEVRARGARSSRPRSPRIRRSACCDARDAARRSRRPRPQARPTMNCAEQDALRDTEDFKEGVKATAERRVPNFVGR